MKYLKIVSVIFAIAAMTTSAQAQLCSVSILPTNPVILCGDSVSLQAVGLSSIPALSTDFNGGAIGAGWQTSATLLYNNPCGPSLDGTPSAWFGNVPLPRTLTTNDFNVTCGGLVCFDLDFAGDDVPGGDCEDPDLTNEGVFFRYSIDFGATWVDIFYFTAVAGYANAYYQWDNYCFSIPAAAWGPNTMFQWDQPSASSNVNDHWGIDNVVITPSDCAYLYDWANIPGGDNPQIQVVSPISTTSYPVMYYDTLLVDFCYDTVTVIVNPLDAIVTTSVDPILCGGCADLNVGMALDPVAGPYSYLWSSNVVDSLIANPQVCYANGTNTYVATILNLTTGCSAIDSVTVGIAPLDAVVTSTIDPIYCGGCTDLAASFVSDPSPAAYTYLWTPNVSDTLAQGPEACPAGIDTYVVEITNTATGCTAMDSITVDVLPLSADVTAVSNNLLCDECTDLNAVMLLDPAPAPYAYSWSPVVDDPLIQSTFICPGSQGGTFNVIATITNTVTGCVATDSTLILAETCVCEFLTFTADSVCQPGAIFDVIGTYEHAHSPTTGTIEVTATNASGSYTTTIVPPFTDSTLFNYLIAGIPNDGSPTTVTIQFTDSLICVSTLVIMPPPLPTVVSITGGADYCDGLTPADVMVEVTGTGTITINYTFNGAPMTITTGAGSVSLGNAEGTYVITGISDNSCSNFAAGSDVINVFQAATITAGVDVEVCYGGLSVLNGQGGVSYTWDNGQVNGVPFVAGTTTTYTVNGTDLNGCTGTDQVTVIVHEYPDAPWVSPDGETYCLNTGYAPFMTDGSGTIYTWYSDAGLTNVIGSGPSLVPASIEGTNTYYVTQTENGCEGEASPIDISFENCEGILEMPNVITFNGDFTNDFFTPIQVENMVSMHTLIVNRWGNFIFETDDMQINWMGLNASGTPVEEGTYFWKVNYTDIAGNKILVHGFVEVVK
ncbi:MAG: gliding motility-associated-like protein [Crocinitomicaceae bacterium]|jgi:gliding motility-associated-like protein